MLTRHVIAESVFTTSYYIRILDVSPESLFLMTRRVFAESVLLRQFLLSQTDSLLMWTLTAAVAEERVTLSHDSERKRTIYVY